MCGRFVLTLPHDALARLFEAVPANDLPDLPNYNTCPTVQIATIRSDEGQRLLAPMRWGFVPHWAKATNDGPLLINARAETIAEKPAFRAAARARRCIVPASGFYEWTKDQDGKRLPWFIHPAGEDPFAFAAIWQRWTPKEGGDELTTCAIVTCAAEGPMAEIHHRMPVILSPKDWPLWLGEAEGKAAPLMRAAPPGALDFHRVDPAVNSNRARGPELIEPLPA